MYKNEDKNYVSCFRIASAPLLPPLLNDDDRKQIRTWQKQAIELEQRLKDKKRRISEVKNRPLPNKLLSCKELYPNKGLIAPGNYNIIDETEMNSIIFNEDHSKQPNLSDVSDNLCSKLPDEQQCSDDTSRSRRGSYVLNQPSDVLNAHLRFISDSTRLKSDLRSETICYTVSGSAESRELDVFYKERGDRSLNKSDRNVIKDDGDIESDGCSKENNHGDENNIINNSCTNKNNNSVGDNKSDRDNSSCFSKFNIGNTHDNKFNSNITNNGITRNKYVGCDIVNNNGNMNLQLEIEDSNFDPCLNNIRKDSTLSLYGIISSDDIQSLYEKFCENPLCDSLLNRSNKNIKCVIDDADYIINNTFDDIHHFQLYNNEFDFLENKMFVPEDSAENVRTVWNQFKDVNVPLNYNNVDNNSFGNKIGLISDNRSKNCNNCNKSTNNTSEVNWNCSNSTDISSGNCLQVSSDSINLSNKRNKNNNTATKLSADNLENSEKNVPVQLTPYKTFYEMANWIKLKHKNELIALIESHTMEFTALLKQFSVLDLHPKSQEMAHVETCSDPFPDNNIDNLEGNLNSSKLLNYENNKFLLNTFPSSFVNEKISDDEEYTISDDANDLFLMNNKETLSDDAASLFDFQTNRFGTVQTTYVDQKQYNEVYNNSCNISESVPKDVYAIKITAAAKGYLTRRLFKTDRVAILVRTIKDCLMTAVSLQQEKDYPTLPDMNFEFMLLKQLTALCNELHCIFTSPPKERMAIIAADREMNMAAAQREVLRQSPNLIR